MTTSRTVSGRIVFREPIAAGEGTVRVLVEDVTRADAAAMVVAASAVPLDRPLAAGEALEFELSVAASDDVALNVRVHVDRSGGGALGEGDRISTQAHPVLTRGAPDHVEIPVTRI